MEGTGKPEYGTAVDMLTKAAIKEMMVPSLLPVVVPVVVGLALGPGGARRPADGHDRDRPLRRDLDDHGGGAGTTRRSTSRTATSAARAPRRTRPPSPATRWAIRTRDTAGPAVNPLIKIINIVALLIVPLLPLPSGGSAASSHAAAAPATVAVVAVPVIVEVASIKVEPGVVKFYFESGKSDLAGGAADALVDVVGALPKARRPSSAAITTPPATRRRTPNSPNSAFSRCATRSSRSACRSTRSS